MHGTQFALSKHSQDENDNTSMMEACYGVRIQISIGTSERPHQLQRVGITTASRSWFELWCRTVVGCFHEGRGM